MNNGVGPIKRKASTKETVLPMRRRLGEVTAYSGRQLISMSPPLLARRVL